ncbi:unnamed protein product [Discula destructiva]
MVDAASKQGILSVVAAGSANQDVIRVTPASSVSAITVAASAANNTFWPCSNYGTLVDRHAPGVDVYSLSVEAGGNRAISGCSMASPHVAGLALYLKSAEPGLDAMETVTARILELSRSIMTSVQGSTTNRVRYNGVEA